MAEAAKHVVDWVAPDFVDLNFGCPVNKVVAKNGGSALLKDCPTLTSVAKAVVQAVAPLPVTAKIRIGWDADSVNAVRVAGILEECGIAALAGAWTHPRPRLFRRSRLARHRRSSPGGRDPGYWQWRFVFSPGSHAPARGNENCWRHDRSRGHECAMDFPADKTLSRHGRIVAAPRVSERWNVIVGHCRTHAESWGDEEQAIRSMRARLMAYSKNFPGAKVLREKFQHVATLTNVEQIAEQHLATTAMMSDFVGQAFAPASRIICERQPTS